MSERETPAPGEGDPLANSRRVVSEAGKTASSKGPDEATRITRLVLVAVILVLIGGLGLLLVFGPAGDDSAREAVSDLSRTQVSIRDSAAETTTTSEPVSTETSAPVETAPPATEAAPNPTPPAVAPPPAPPGQPAATVRPAALEIFYGVDSQGRLPVKVGQGTQISIRNTGGAEGAWALNATGALRIDGVSGKNGRVPGGQVTVVTVTVDAATAPTAPTDATIRFDTPDGESRTIQVQISP